MKKVRFYEFVCIALVATLIVIIGWKAQIDHGLPLPELKDLPRVLAVSIIALILCVGGMVISCLVIEKYVILPDPEHELKNAVGETRDENPYCHVRVVRNGSDQNGGK